MGYYLVTFSLLILLSIINCQEACQKGCKGVNSGNQLLRLTDGTTYQYSFESEATIVLKHDDKQEITTRIWGQALISYQSECLYALRLRKIQLDVPTSQATIANIEKTVTFTINDGVISDEICTEADDTQNSLNVKRAVISLLQADLNSHYETDVYGRCPTETTTRTDGDLVTVTKGRKLNKCSHREHIKHDFIMTNFDWHSDVKSSPLLGSSYEMEQKFKNGVLEYAEVTEEYDYFLYTSGKTGAKARIITKLSYQSTEKEVLKLNTNSKKSIIFDRPHPVTSTNSNVDTISKVLQETQNTMKTHVNEDSAKMFGQLLRIMRHSTKDDILTVYGQVKAGAGFSDIPETKKILLDALFGAGSGDAIEVAIELLKNNELSEYEKLKLFVRLPTIQHVTKGALKAAVTIIDNDKLPRQALLGIGVLAARYCRDHYCDDNMDEIKKIAEKLIQLTNGGKAANKKQENQIVTALKALGNMKTIPKSHVSSVVQIAANKNQVSSRVRTTAFDVLEKSACEPVVKETSLKILQDIQEDSEIRIKAYLLLVKCPSNQLSKNLKELLKSEQSYQLGSFITTHLHNIRNSANHDKEHVRQYLGTIEAPKRFPIDFTRYSFNSEFSSSIGRLGVGGSSESNVIYSQKSFIPRSTNVNITMQVFGHLVNLLEIGVRQENIEKLAEQYFGPAGHLRTKIESNDVLESERESLPKLWHKMKARFDKSFRTKRDLSKTDIQAFNKQMKYGGSELDHDLDLDISLKLFGNELMFFNWNEKTAETRPDEIVNRLFDHIDRFTENLEDFHYLYENHMSIMDLEFAYPTSSGFALKFGAEAVAAVHFLTTGRLDVKQWLKDPKNFQAKLMIVPSVNIEMLGQLSIDSEIYETGLIVSTTALSSTGMDITYRTIENGKGFDLKLGLPVDKNVLVSLNHDVVFNTREIGKRDTSVPIKYPTRQDPTTNCNKELNTFIGLNICVQANDLSKLRILEPTKFEIWAERKDLTHYHLRATVNTKELETKMDVVFNTPGSKTNRKIHLTRIFNTTADWSMMSSISNLKLPYDNYHFNVYLRNMADEKSVELLVKSNQMEAVAKIGAKINGDDKKRVYSPILILKSDKDPNLMNMIPIKIEGKLIVEGERGLMALKKLQFEDAKILLKNKPPILISGTGKVHVAANDYDVDLKISRESNFITLKSNLNYGDSNKFDFGFETENSVNPQTNFRLKTKSYKKPESLEASLSLVYGPDLNSKTNELSLRHTSAHNFETWKSFTFETKNALKFPPLLLDSNLDLTLKPNYLNEHFIWKYDKLEVSLDTHGHLHKKFPGDYEFELKMAALGNKLTVQLLREINDAKTASKIVNEILMNDIKLTVNGELTHNIQKEMKNFEIGADLILGYSKKPDPVHITGLVKLLDKVYSSHLKIQRADRLLLDQKADYDFNKKSANMLLKVDGVVDMTGTSTDGETGVIRVTLIKLKKNIEIGGKIKNQKPNFDFDLEISHDFGGESIPIRKVFVFESRNIIESLNAFKSTDKIEWGGNVFTTHLDYLHDIEKGRNKMAGKLEGSLSNKYYGLLRVDRDLTYLNGVLNGKFDYDVIVNKNKDVGKGLKANLKAEFKDMNLKENSVNVNYNLLVENDDKKWLDGVFSLTRLRVGDKEAAGRKTSMMTKVSGEVVPKELQFTYESSHLMKSMEYKIRTKYGPDFQNDLKAHFNYDLKSSDEKKMTGDVSSEFKFGNSNRFKVIKVQGSANVVRSIKDKSIKGEFKTSLRLDDDTFNANVVTKLTHRKGSVSGHVQVPKQAEPLKFDIGYKYDVKDDKFLENGEISLKIDYDKEKQVKISTSLEKPSLNEIIVNLEMLTPRDSMKKINTRFWHKRSNNGKNFETKLSLTANDKTYQLSNELKVSETAPSVEIKLDYPDGKKSRVFARFNRVSMTKREFNGELSVESVNGFGLAISGDANLQSIETFHIKVVANSEKLGWNNIILQANRKGSNVDKMIQFSAKQGDKVLITGSTNYQIREENGKVIVEGTGSFESKGETKTANFKYTRQSLELARDGEQGINIVINTSFGNKEITGELKLTNKQFRVLNSYCEEKEQCAHIEVYSKTNHMDLAEFNHELEVAIDLKKLGLNKVFGLKSITNRKHLVLDHKVDIHFEAPESNKYQYRVYLHPNDAGIVLKFPKREISFESNYSVDKSKNSLLVNPMKFEVALYTNKQLAPDKKTVLSAFIEFDHNHSAGNAKSELKLTGKGLQKDLSIKMAGNYDLSARLADFTADLDIFDEKADKVQINGKMMLESSATVGYKKTITIDAKSKGLNWNVNYAEDQWLNSSALRYAYKLDYSLDNVKCSSLLLFDLRKDRIESQVKIFNQKLFHGNVQMDLKPKEQSFNADLEMIALKPVSGRLEIKNLNTFIATVHKKETPGQKLQTSGGLILGQIADFRISAIVDGPKEDVLHASINLDEANFLKSNYGFNSDRAKNLLQMFQRDINDSLKDLKMTVEKYEKDTSSEMAHMIEVLRKHMPNFEPLVDYYKQELAIIRDEIASDKAVQQATEFIKSVFGAVIRTMSDLIDRLNEIRLKLKTALQENYQKVHDVFVNDFAPEIRRIVQRLLNATISTIESITNIVFICLIKMADILKMYQADLNQIATTISESIQDVGRVAVKSFATMRQELIRVLDALYEDIKATPFIEFLKEKYENFDFRVKLSDYLTKPMNELIETIKDIMADGEWKDFLSTLHSYVEKKLNNENVEDSKEIKNILKTFVKAMESSLNSIKSSDLLQQNIKNIFENLYPISFWTYTKLPTLSSIKLNPLPLHYGMMWRPNELLHPFEMTAAIIHGQHIITFDKKHVSLAGKCGFIMATDSLDGNFTIYADNNPDSGLLDSISLIDRSGNSLTLKKDATVTLNGSPNEFPVRTKSSAAYRLFNSIHLASKYGVRVDCTLDLTVCGFMVSGFYHNRLRGLLGNGNNEMYDDLTLPSGQISDSETNFLNAYKVTTGCANVQPTDHSLAHMQNAGCDALFGMQSNMALCYPFVSNEPYKIACQHGTALKNKDTECDIATAYVGICMAHGVPIKVPDKCVKCKNDKNDNVLGDTFSVKTPSNVADIVIVLDQNKEYEVVYKDLIQPLITQVTNEMNSKGLTDINFALIGYGGGQRRWPSLYTSNGGLMKFNGITTNLKFTDPKNESPYLKTGVDKIDKFLDGVRHTTVYELFDDQIGYKAYRMARNYPFRPNAVKAIVSFAHDCATSKLAHLARLQILLKGKSEIVHHTFTTVANLELNATTSDSKSAKSIVSFSKLQVQFYGETKKKEGGATTLTSNELKFKRNDMCIDTTLHLGGTVYVADNFLAAKQAQKKTYMQMFAQNLVQDLLQHKHGYDCECKRYGPFYGRNMCKIVK